MAAMAIPQVLAGMDRARTVGAARYFAQRCGAARMQAITRSANVAIRFQPRDEDYVMQMFVDRNDNGVRIADIDSGVDTPLTEPASLQRDFPGVRIGIAPDLPIGSDPVKVGSGGLMSFTPLGTATPGSIFIVGKDGTQFAVRVLGATARTRLERYDARARRWLPLW